MRHFFVLLAASAVLALAHSAVLVSKPATNDVYDKVSDDVKDPAYDVYDPLLDDSDDDDDDDLEGEDNIDPNTVIDGIPLSLLSKEEIQELLEEDDRLTEIDLDLAATVQALKVRDAKRKKRWIPVAIRLFQAGRTLFKASRFAKTTSSGARITRHYQRRGSFRDAQRDFSRFRPDNQKSFSGKISGQTGTVGKHRVTVRDGSSSGRPTLEIRSPRARGGETVRKFRYD